MQILHQPRFFLCSWTKSLAFLQKDLLTHFCTRFLSVVSPKYSVVKILSKDSSISTPTWLGVFRQIEDNIKISYIQQKKLNKFFLNLSKKIQPKTLRFFRFSYTLSEKSVWKCSLVKNNNNQKSFILNKD